MVDSVPWRSAIPAGIYGDIRPFLRPRRRGASSVAAGLLSRMGSSASAATPNSNISIWTRRGAGGLAAAEALLSELAGRLMLLRHYPVLLLDRATPGSPGRAMSQSASQIKPAGKPTTTRPSP